MVDAAQPSSLLRLKPGMTLHEIDQDLDVLDTLLRDRARRCRRTAKAAHAAGDIIKAQKYHSCARCYEYAIQAIERKFGAAPF